MVKPLSSTQRHSPITPFFNVFPRQGDSLPLRQTDKPNWVTGARVRRVLLFVVAAALTGAGARVESQMLPAQAGDPPPVVAVHPAPSNQPPESAVVFEGLASFGNYNLFASGSGCKLWTGGVEYDRHSWGEFLRGQMDYVAEVLPFVLLQEPTKSDFHGYPLTPERRLVPGLGVSPIGARLLWRPGRRIEPYMEEKGGMAGFTRKVLNANSTYEEFTLQSATGVLIRTGGRFDVRVSLYSDFHMSNGFMVATNPGLDVMNATFGLSYDLGGRRGPVR
jgi:hypothetical protein